MTLSIFNPLAASAPKQGRSGTGLLRQLLGTVAALGLILAVTQARADDPVPMAPPTQADGGQTNADASQDTVFNWTQIPVNQQVPLTRATFDQGGYQLTDTVGETIVVPFENQNLYVMKFARSQNDTMYFVNDGTVPVLYVPQNGYLENAAADGAHWYPFPQEYTPPPYPVYLGIAPSWNAFVGMGWYPGMTYWGGYWTGAGFVSGAVFVPTPGLFITIGGQPYYGWASYHEYVVYHPAPYSVRVVNANVYHLARRPYAAHRPFVGSPHPYIQRRPLPTRRVFQGAGPNAGTARVHSGPVHVPGSPAPAYHAPAPAPIYHAPAPAPIYHAPAPAYHAPAPAYHAPAPVYRAPAPVRRTQGNGNH